MYKRKTKKPLPIIIKKEDVLRKTLRVQYNENIFSTMDRLGLTFDYAILLDKTYSLKTYEKCYHTILSKLQDNLLEVINHEPMSTETAKEIENMLQTIFTIHDVYENLKSGSYSGNMIKKLRYERKYNKYFSITHARTIIDSFENNVYKRSSQKPNDKVLQVIDYFKNINTNNLAHQADILLTLTTRLQLDIII